MDSGSNQCDKDSNCPDALPVGESMEPVVSMSVGRVYPPGMGLRPKGVSSAAQGNLYDHSERETHPRSC